MSDPGEVMFRSRCPCGRRLRIRNAWAGRVVRCPKCGRGIAITDADLRAAASGTSLAPLVIDTREAKEALPLHAARLRPARKDAQPGLTSGAAPADPDALLFEARAGRLGLGLPTVAPSAEDAGMPSADSDVAAAAGVRRSFLSDLLAGFYFAGRPANALHLTATAVAFALPLVVLSLMPRRVYVLVWPVAALIGVLVFVYVIQFCWRLLLRSAAGEDDMPIAEAAWDLWDDGVKPLLWLTLITLVCATPAMWLYLSLPAGAAWKPLLILGALAAGALPWPMAILSIAIGESVIYLRPDWLVRGIIGVGAAYVVVWGILLAVAAAWTYFLTVDNPLAHMPVVGDIVLPIVSALANLYFAYVLFRSVGLIFRHYRQRLPWKF